MVAGRLARRVILLFAGVAAAVILVLSLAGWLLGPPIVALVSGDRFAISGGIAAVIVASAGLVAAMCVTGPALIAARRHTANLVGWVVAAGLTVALLLTPLEETARIALALTLPPMIGLLLHVGALLRTPLVLTPEQASD